MTARYLLIGIGNPGSRYAQTRHNIGFKVIDVLAELLHIKVVDKKFGGLLGKGKFAGRELVLLKPMKFVNCSGQVVATVVGFHKLNLSKILVITDDMALEPGRIRLRASGSSGGHNGLADIIEKLGSEDINRLRIGIGQSGGLSDYDYVLSAPSPEQKPLLDEAIDKSKEAVLYWIENGIEAAMNKFNS
ncbi:MAG: aminoacyl-tRNA hydrolase [Sedimentisphaerales bacterium]|nr:aminoacyl-tRNA hydrolase [Sedimentisphaerales bacterium]